MAPRRTLPLTESNLLSSNYYFLFNDYDWMNKNNAKDFVLHSLLVTAPFHQICNDIGVFSDLVEGYKDLGFDLLVQREYDQERIDLDIFKNFLSERRKIHFFPPLTVALIPKAYGNHNEKINCEILFKDTTPEEFGSLTFKLGNNYLTERFNWEHETITEIKSKFDSNSSEYPYLDYKSGVIKWDKLIFNAIIIDGQHRFLSLKKFIGQNQINPAHCQIPLNFITIIPKPNKLIEFNSLVEIARELFIDINKNAKNVSESRQILLDDRDLKMFLTRNSIRQYNRLKADSFYQWNNTTDNRSIYLKKIPQEIVSWNLELNSEDKENLNKLSLNQVTSTTLLYRIIKEFILSPKDKEEDIFDAFYRVFNFDSYAPETEEEIQVFGKIKSKKESYKAEFQEINEDKNSKKSEHEDIYADDLSENPFNSEPFERKLFSLDEKAFDFDKDINLWLSNWFYEKSNYGKFITRFYTLFDPYQKIIKILEPIFQKNKLDDYKEIIDILIDPNPKKKFSDFNDSISQDNKQYFKEITKNLEKIKNESADTRNLIFQKAVLSNLDHIFKVLSEIDPTSTWDARIDKFITSINKLYNSKTFDRKNLKVRFDSDCFLSDVSEGKFKIEEVKVWDGIWNDITGNILYKDSDAPKIGHYILILALGVYSTESFEILLQTSFKESVNKVRDCYRTFYLNKVKIDQGYNSQQEVWTNIFTSNNKREKLNVECINIIKKAFEMFR